MDVNAPPPRQEMANNERQRHFGTFGFVQVRQALTKSRLKSLVEDYHRTMDTNELRLPINELGQAPAFVSACMGYASASIVDLATNEQSLVFAEALLGGPAICVQAAAYQRSGDTRWHSDNLDARYKGLKLYINLDPVDENSGALRVIVGSHLEQTRRSLLPKRYEAAEQQFGLAADQLPATILSSEPGDLSAFDLRIWHAVCGTRSLRRIVELTYYKAPQTPSERAGFVAQMLAHQHQARISGSSYYSGFWRSSGGPRHQRGLQILAKLDLLEAVPPVEKQ